MRQISSWQAASFSAALLFSAVAQVAHSEVSATPSPSPFGGVLKHNLYLCTESPHLYLPMILAIVGNNNEFDIIIDGSIIDESSVTLLFLGSPESALSIDCITRSEVFTQYVSEAVKGASRTIPESMIIPGGDEDKLMPVDANTQWDKSGPTVDWYFGFCFTDIEICDDSVLGLFSDMIKGNEAWPSRAP
ncbi:MAG TPA: hypothetical protein VGN80_01895 [Devosiaceae bacterium]|jgi:hypothetical protein|nr:hypothetical protein [Devosiaceae bacterium]